MGERPESDQGTDDSDTTFRGSIRKISMAGLVSVQPEHGDAVWYRPVDGKVAALVRRIPAGDACIARVRGDKLVHIAPRLDVLAPAKSAAPVPVRAETVAPDPKPAAPVKGRVKAMPKPNAQPAGFYENNARHKAERTEDQALRGLHGMQERAGTDMYSKDRQCSDCRAFVHVKSSFIGGRCHPCQGRNDARITAENAALSETEKRAPATKRNGAPRKRQG